MLCKLHSVVDVTGGHHGDDSKRQTLRAGTSKAILTPPQSWITFSIFLQSGHPARTPLVTESSEYPKMAGIYLVSLVVRKCSPLELKNHNIITAIPGTIRGASM